MHKQSNNAEAAGVQYHSWVSQQSSEYTRPPRLRFPFLGGVCSPGAGVLALLASPALSPRFSGIAPEPAVVAEDVAVGWEDAVLGCRGICTGDALVGSVQQKL